MRLIPAFLCIVLFVLITSVAFVFASNPPPCITCNELADSFQVHLLSELHEPENQFEVWAYYEDTSISPPRQPVNDSILIVEIRNVDGLSEIYKIYTDDAGNAIFDYEDWNDACINFKVLYCPFCLPDSEECGFRECLEYSSISTDSGTYTNIIGAVETIDSIPAAPGASPPVELDSRRFLPEFVTTTYCPPPAPLSGTPAMCLPLLVIFSMLAGSLYMTGRNPFAGFSMGGAKIGRHIRYQARGRGFHFSGMAALSAISTVTRASKTGMTKDKKTGERGGSKALGKQEKAQANNRGFLGMGGLSSKTSRFSALSNRGGQIKRLMKDSLKGKTDSKGKALSFNERLKRGNKWIESTASGAGRDTATSVAVKPGESQFLPGSSGMSPRLSELGSHAGLGLVVYLLSATTIGGIVDSIYRSATGQSIFEALFVDHERRAVQDATSFDEIAEQRCVRNADGRIIALNIDIDGRERVTVIGSRPGEEEGTTVYTVNVPVSSEFAGEETVVVDEHGTAVPTPSGQTNRGTFEVTTDSRNRVIQIAYQAPSSINLSGPNASPWVAGAAPADLIAGTERVVVRVGADGSPQFTVEYQIRGSDGRAETRTSPITAPVAGTDIEGLGDRMNFAGVNATYGGIVAESGFSLGSNASDFTNAYSGGLEDLRAAAASSSENTQRAQQENQHDLNRALRDVDPNYVRSVRAEYADNLVGFLVAGTSGSTAGVDLRETSFEGQPAGPGYDVSYAGSRGRVEGGRPNDRMDPSSSIALNIGQAWGRTIGDSDFAGQVAEASGLEGSGRVQFTRVLGIALARSDHSPEDFRSMTLDEFQGVLRDNGLSEDVARDVGAGALARVQDGFADLERELTREGNRIGADATDRLMGSSVAQVSGVVQGAGSLFDDNVGSLLQDRLTDPQLAEVAPQLREQAFLDGMGDSVGGAQASLGVNAGSGPNSNIVGFEQFGGNMASLRENTEDYVQQVAIDRAHRSGHLSDEDYQESNRAFDEFIRARRIEESGAMDPGQEFRARENTERYIMDGNYTGAIYELDRRRVAYEQAEDTATAERYAEARRLVAGHAGESGFSASQAQEHVDEYRAAIGIPEEREQARQEATLRNHVYHTPMPSDSELNDNAERRRANRLASEAYGHNTQARANGSEILIGVREHLIEANPTFSKDKKN
ncbi:MAG: hypothetical protein ABIJ10_07340 [Candidatus Micrarchaeota archaeon]|nr:hypothetical protein [Candidatus Micrarchaeota archaeon]MBU1886506.1 hypothetical protein [Candidatus Micrarchaeota archaeon]